MSPSTDPGRGTDVSGAASFRTEVDGASVVIHVSGELDATSGSHLRTLLADALEPLPATVELDLADVTFIDSVGLSVLVSAHNRTKAVGAPLILRNVSGTCRRVFEITRLHEVLDLR